MDYHTPIHNEVLEALYKINLSPYETRVLLFIFRHTFGFIDQKTGKRRKYYQMSASFIGRGIGKDRRLVLRALKGLKKKGCISRDVSKTGLSKAFMRLTDISRDAGASVETPSVEMSPSVKNDVKTDISRDAQKEKGRETYKEKEHVREYLLNIPEEDIVKLKGKFNVSTTDIKRKGESLYNWSLNSKKNIKVPFAVLRNALERDFGYKFNT